MIERYMSCEKLSEIVVHGDTVYLCGQIAENLDGDVVAQTREVFSLIEARLADVGSDTSKMLACTVYFKHQQDVPLVNKEWCAWLKDCPKPARTGVIADLVNEKILIEITVIAAK
jgi:enamine deaminase RidA (YjgF/YER057c/UK114 family)